MPSRVVFGAIATNLADGRAFSDRHTAFYRERAAGGCGMIVTEDASIHPGDWPYERCPAAAEAGPGWAAIVEACRPFGTVVVAGLSHAGGQSTSAFSQRELWAPSDEPDVNTREVPKIMEQADIDAVIAGFGEAAAAAVGAGLDGVEINVGQFSLIRQFLSGLTNRRGDRYGEDRSLLARQVLEAARGRVGDAIVGLRLSCDELAPWAGITPESAAELAAEFAPFVDYLTVVRGSIFSATETRPTAHHPPGFNLELVGGIRSAVAAGTDSPIPVIGQGSIVSLDQANQAIADGRCDGVEMTRAQLADPELVVRAAAGDRPRPCVRCNQLCNVRDNRNPIISCIANPRAGHETIDPPEPASDRTSGGDQASQTNRSNQAADADRSPGGERSRVIVIGGGPAGLEAARVAARRGFTVQLHDAADRLGGMARTAAVSPAHQPLSDLVDWLEHDAAAHGVDFHLGSTVDAGNLGGAESFDGHVVLATGGTVGHRTYELDPGLPVVDAAALLATIGGGEPRADEIDRLLPGAEVAIWDPIGGPIAVAVAEIIATMRPTVSLITPDAIAGNMLSLTGDLAGSNVRLQQAGVTIVRRQRLVRASADGLDLVQVFTGETQRLTADVLIDASARQPNDELAAKLPSAIRVGDAVAPRTVAEAIREGRAAAMALPMNGATR